MNDYDVVVAGGGLVGATLACALGASLLRIAVINPVDVAPEPQARQDLRVSALTAASIARLERLGAWTDAVRARAQVFREMHVWDRDEFIHFDAAEAGCPYLGFIVENQSVLSALWSRLRQLPNVDVRAPAKIEALKLDAEAAEVELTTGERLSARLLVGADGVQSRVRGAAGLSSVGWRYDQIAIVANVSIGESHRETAWQRFLDTGPLALLPLPGNRCSIVWSCTRSRAESLSGLDDAQFSGELQAAFGDTLGRLEIASDRLVFPLALAHATRYVSERVALVGDAAHQVHPLAGQGVNLGIGDADALAGILIEAARVGRDIGAQRVLRNFERARKEDNLGMLAVTDGLYRLFAQTLPTVSGLRRAGMSALNGLPPLKNAIMRYAMGLGSFVP